MGTADAAPALAASCRRRRRSAADRRRAACRAVGRDSDQLAQLLVAAAADRHALAAAQARGVAVGAGALDRLQVRQADDERAVHAQEAGGVELLLDLGDALRLEVALAVGVDGEVVALGLDALDLLDRDHVHLLAVADQDALQRRAAAGDQRVDALPGRRRRARARVQRAGAREGVVEARLRERLEQVVHRVQLEGLDRVLVVGGGEDYARAAAGQLQHLQAGQARHLDVHEHEVGVQRADLLDGIEAVLAFADDLDVRMPPQVFADQVARQVLVVDDQRAQAGCCRCHAPVSFSAGRLISMANCVSLRCQAMRARVPYSTARRSRMFFSPTPWLPDGASSRATGLATATCSQPSRTSASTVIVPPPSTWRMPCLIAFSSSGCSVIGGSRHSAASGLTRSSAWSLAPKRRFSIARKCSLSVTSSPSVMRSRSASASVRRKNCARSTVISRAAAGSKPVSALIELRLLNRKCGLICVRSICSSASRASTRDSASRRAASCTVSNAMSTSCASSDSRYSAKPAAKYSTQPGELIVTKGRPRRMSPA